MLLNVLSCKGVQHASVNSAKIALSLMLTLILTQTLTLILTLIPTLALILTQTLTQTEEKPGCRTVSNNGSGSGLAPAQNILAVQVWFGFT